MPLLDLNVQPFLASERGLNIYRLDVWSQQAGADRPRAAGPPGRHRVTYFNAHFSEVIFRLLLVDEELVIETVRALLMGTPAGSAPVAALAWLAGILAVAIVWSVILFQRQAGRR